MTSPATQQTLMIGGVVRERLRDPLGQVTGCAGEVLSDYSGFQVALFEADPSLLGNGNFMANTLCGKAPLT
jgi:hypothetical protein